MKRNKSILYTTMLAVLLSLVSVSCSTTARLGEGEVLYTGVKKLNYKENNTKIDGDVQDQIFEAIDVAPNNSLYSPYYRTPFPMGV